MTRYYIIKTGVTTHFLSILSTRVVRACSELLFFCRLLCIIFPAMRIRKDNDIYNEEEILLIAKASDALAHPLRVELFRYIYTENIARRQVCNKDLVAEFGYSQSTVSQHMKKLLISGLVEAKKQESFTYYYVNLGLLGRYLNSVKKLNT